MESFWDLFWSQHRHQILPIIDPERFGFRSCDRVVPRWLQDLPKRAPGGVLGSSWGVLGPLLGARGPSLEGLGGLLGRLERILGSLGTVLAAHEAINGSCWVVLECDLLIQFIDSIY